MRTLLRMTLIGGTVAALSGCGGAKLAPGKQNAAAALFSASEGTGPTGTGALYNLATQNLTVSMSCPNGGQLSITDNFTNPDAGTADGGTTTAVGYTIAYSNCSFDGKNWLDGSLNVQMTSTFDGMSWDFTFQLSGQVSFSGQISDFVNANVTETMSATDLASGSGASITVGLNGTITDSSGTYTYNNESVSFTVGQLQPAS